jgi:hyperosmotically inducible periplasmic protein
MKPRSNRQAIVLAVFLSCSLSIEFLPTGGSAMTGRTEENIDDASITALVKTTLGGDTGLVRVDVDTHRGVVSLNGLVEYADQRERAEELARRVDGVKSVINNLAIISRSKASTGCCSRFTG